MDIYPKVVITGSWGRLFPNFFEKLPHWHPKGLYQLSFPLAIRNVPFTAQLLQHKLLSEFLILAILTNVRLNLRVLLIYISLMIKNVEHFLKCLLAILDSSVENSLCRFVLQFYIGLFVLLMTNFLSSLLILEIRPLSDWG